MLGKLKVECGYQFTSKLEGMFNDIKISNDAMEAYHSYLENKQVRLLEWFSLNRQPV